MQESGLINHKPEKDSARDLFQRDRVSGAPGAY